MKKILSLAFIAALGFSCTDDDIRSEHTLDQGPKIVGFTSKAETVSYFSDQGDVTINFPVELIGRGNGGNVSGNITVGYEVDPASTATEGVEFDFADASFSTVIPSGGTFSYIPIVVHTGSLNPTQKTVLTIRLTDATNSTVVGSQYQSFDVIFVGCQSQLEGNYTASVLRTDQAAPTVFPSEDITQTSVNNFKSQRSGNYQIGVLQGTNGYFFADICGEITVMEMQLNQVYSNILRPDPSKNGLDGTVTDNDHFQTEYQIGFTSNTIWRNYRCTYVRN